MAMFTVDDLARDLKVKNEDLLKQLATMGFNVDSPESALETDDPAALRAELVTALPQREVIEKRIKPTVIRRRVKKKPPSEQLSKKEPAAKPIEVAKQVEAEAPETEQPKIKDTPKKTPKKTKKAQPAKILERPAPAQVIESAPEPEPAPEPLEASVEPEPVSAEPEVAPEQETVETEAPEAKAEVEEVAEAAEPESAPEEEKTVSEEPVEPKQVAEQAEPAEKEEEAEAQKADKPGEEKGHKKKKKKEKKLQPAQIIGHVDLKPAPEPQPPSRPEATPEPTRTPRRPQPPRPGQPEQLGAVPVPAPQKEDARGKKKKEKKWRDQDEAAGGADKGKPRRRKEVLLRGDIYDNERPRGRMRGKSKKPKQRKTEITIPRASKRRIKLPESITVANLAHKMSVKASEVIQQLLGQGVVASMNEGIDYDTALLVASEFGFEAEHAEHSEVDMLPKTVLDTEENLKPRPPVVTMMGHVDHGKTSLLDHIRQAHVTESEAGGITQHIGAYKVRMPNGDIVFLDTPGHEAFTTMRARGAHVTDFVVLVVAADDGVMDQTREAINHARAAEVPIVVAVNKMDKPEADKDRVIRELSELALIPEDWGGDTLYAFVSAKTGDGIDSLLETILLQAEIMELRANPDKPATGTVIEARLDKGRGPVATVLVREGLLRVGDPFVAGVHHGKVRAMFDHDGKSTDEAGPATPVGVQGFSGVPEAGEPFLVVDEERLAKQIGTHRQAKIRQQEAAVVSGPTSLEDLMARLQEGELIELNLVLKADVQGSVEALKEALEGITAQTVTVKVIHSGVGTVTESDVMLAAASDAIILGFNVRPTPKTTQLAEEKSVDLRLYSVIYEALEDVRKAMEGLLAPVEKEEVVGNVEVRQVFTISRIGTIAGCYVTSGKIQRSNNVRLVRDGAVVYDGKITSLKRFRDDVKEALEGYECGIALHNFNDIKVGDVIEAYVIEQESATISTEEFKAGRK